MNLLKPTLDKIHKNSLMLSEHWNGSREYRLFSGISMMTRRHQVFGEIEFMIQWVERRGSRVEH